MTSHKEDGEHHLVFEILHNCKHKCGRSINVFGILKQTFKRFLKKTKLHITILPDMFNVCCLFHNLILGKREVDVEEFMWLIQFEDLQKDALNTNGLQ
jgi:hypothetical protein